MRRLLLALSLIFAAIHPVAAQRLDTTGVALPRVIVRAASPVDSIRAGDVLRLRFWREPDYSGDFPVNSRGEVVLPRLGHTVVTGMTLDDIERKLVAAYSTYLENPTLEITPLLRVVVLGAVRQPGSYLVEPTMTVVDVIAKAGGASPDGETNSVTLVRGSQRLSDTFDPGSRVALMTMQSGDQLIVPQRSWVARNPWAVTTAGSFVTTLIVLLHR